jgi:hypothetical protein
MMTQSNHVMSRRAAVQAILERIASDAGYRQRLIEHPATALQSFVNSTTVDDTPEVVGLCRYTICSPYTCRFSHWVN